MTQTAWVPTSAIQEAVKGREGEILHDARPMKTRRTKAQMAQLFGAAEAFERNLYLSIAASSGADQ